jgi:hypothetical protein
MVLFAPNFAVIFGSHFEEFISSVSGKLTALVSQLFQFSSGEWLDIRSDSKVLIENFHRVDTANRSCNRQPRGYDQNCRGVSTGKVSDRQIGRDLQLLQRAMDEDDPLETFLASRPQHQLSESPSSER